MRPGAALAGRRRPLPGARLLVLAVTAVVGFLLVSQLGTGEPIRQRLETESEPNLARILARLTDEADALRDEIGDLKLQLLNLRNSSRAGDAADRAAEEQRRALEVLAGTVPVSGPGLTLVVEDPEGAVAYETLIDAVQELRDAGAEAIGVNGVRIGASSSLGQSDGRVTVDGTRLVPPFRVVAIGQAATLEGGLKIPGGVLDALDALHGVRAEVQRSARLDVPALARAPVFRVARPVGSRP